MKPLSDCVTVIIVCVVATVVVCALVIFLTWSFSIGRTEREKSVITECEKIGGKLMTVYDAQSFRPDAITCVPAGITVMPVEKP